MPSGNVCPRRRAIRFRMTPCACAEGTNETQPLGSPPMESAHVPMPSTKADERSWVSSARHPYLALSPAGPEIPERGDASLQSRRNDEPDAFALLLGPSPLPLY